MTTDEYVEIIAAVITYGRGCSSGREVGDGLKTVVDLIFPHVDVPWGDA